MSLRNLTHGSSFIMKDKSRTKGGRKAQGVSVMKDKSKEVKIEETESSHTLGGGGKVVSWEREGDRVCLLPCYQIHLDTSISPI